jgi:hypothetical protein
MDFITNLIFNNPVVSIIVVVVLWIGILIFRHRRIDARYGVTVSGGRTGIIAVCLDQYTVHADYKVGVTVDFIIDAASFVTADKQPLSEQMRAEVVKTLLTWAKARGTTLSIIDN